MPGDRDTRESLIENAVVHFALRLGIESNKLNLMGHRGMPDRVFWIPGGRPLLIEFKRAGCAPSKLQAYKIQKLKGLGYSVYVVDTREEGQRVIIKAVEAAS